MSIFENILSYKDSILFISFEVLQIIIISKNLYYLNIKEYFYCENIFRNIKEYF